MTTVRPRVPVEAYLLFGALVYGLGFYLLLPRGVSMGIDEFAYYRSVIETLQHHRPWVDDYLEPWSAGLCLLSAGTYRLTGSFALATQGLLVAFSAAAVWATARLLCDRGFAEGRALLVSVLIMTGPIVLPEFFTFGSSPLYLVCLLFVVLAAERGRWVGFTAVWLPAIASRQTAIMWCILPIAALLQRRPNPERAGARWVGPAITLVLGIVCFGLLAIGMNRTYAYERMTRPQAIAFLQGLRHLHGLGRFAGKFVVGGCILSLAMGVGLWAKDPTRTLRGRYGQLAFALVVVLFIAKYAHLVEPPNWFGHQHPHWRQVVFLDLLLLAGMGTLGLVGLQRATVSWPLIFTGAAVLLAICVHEPVWPSYLIEPALLGMLAGLPLTRPNAPHPIARPCRTVDLRLLVVGAALALCQLSFAVAFKFGIDLAWAEIRMGELAIREGKMTIGDADWSLWQLQRWRVLPYLYAHPGSRQTLDTVLRSLRSPGGPAGFSETLPPAIERWLGGGGTPPAGSRVLDEESVRCCWFFNAHVVLYRLPGRANGYLLANAAPTDFREQDYPLNDKEWRAFIRTEPAEGFRPAR
ncbi:MAG TPA: hypothetical protein VHE61_12500 [Opitutaceae bacterium]|nr:hypothetical protein [Opitutaceae bacterium]